MEAKGGTTNVNGHLYVGYNGEGSFKQEGSNTTVTGVIFVGGTESAQGNGHLLISAGTIKSAGIDVGWTAQMGDVTQTGGDVSGDLQVGTGLSASVE
jgi:hypothetical protein